MRSSSYKISFWFPPAPSHSVANDGMALSCEPYLQYFPASMIALFLPRPSYIRYCSIQSWRRLSQCDERLGASLHSIGRRMRLLQPPAPRRHTQQVTYTRTGRKMPPTSIFRPAEQAVLQLPAPKYPNTRNWVALQCLPCCGTCTGYTVHERRCLCCTFALALFSARRALPSHGRPRSRSVRRSTAV